MPVVHCYFCDQTYKVPDAARGKQVACRNCFRKLDVPLVDAPPPATSPFPELKPDESAELAAAKAARPKPPAKLPVKPDVIAEPTMEVSRPKPAAPVAKVIPAQKPKSAPSSPAESDRWDFDAAAFESAGSLSEEFGALPPSTRKKKRQAKWKWDFKLPTIRLGGIEPNPDFAPFENSLEIALLLNVLAAMVLLPMAALEPRFFAFEVLWYLSWLMTGLYFIDATFAGGLLRVLLIFSVPGVLVTLSYSDVAISRAIFVASMCVWGPYFLFVRVIRFKHFWPADLLAGITFLSYRLAYKVATDRAWHDWVQTFKKNWLSHWYP